jgi:hypothetical protein
MSTRITILTLAIALAALTLNTPPAGAHATRELTGVFGHFSEPEGIAVDLETGNVYVAEPITDVVDIFNATGGPPVGGVPAQITELGLFRGSKASVAVDNSCYEHEPRLTGKACEEYDPAYGDIYVTHNNQKPPYGIEKLKLNADDEYEKIELIPVGEIDLPEGLAVDAQGDVYADSFSGESVVEIKKNVEKVVSGGKEEFTESLERVAIPQSIEYVLGYIAIDALGDVYVSNGHEGGGVKDKGVGKLRVSAGGVVLSEEVFAPPFPRENLFRPLAVDRVSGEVFVGDGAYIAEYDAAGALQLEFGSGEQIGGSLVGEQAVSGIAVNDTAGRVYVANESAGDVDVFGQVIEPPIIPGEQPVASDLTRTSALLAGTANPEGSEGSYFYQYVPAGEYESGAADPYVAGARTATVALPAGHADESIERIVLAGLTPGTTYHYRLVVSNASEAVYGPDETFTTAPPTPPAASTGTASGVSATGATLVGVVDPRGLETSYVFEVGTDTSYAGAKLYGNAGSSTGEVPVTVSLQYLVPGTTYHYRLVARSFDGTSYGQDKTFTTLPVGSSVTQPAATPLIASPTVVFPSVAGAITEPVGAKAKPRKALTGAQKLTAALRACHKQRPRKRRASCEARARRTYGRAGKSDHSKKR